MEFLVKGGIPSGVINQSCFLLKEHNFLDHRYLKYVLHKGVRPLPTQYILEAAPDLPRLSDIPLYLLPVVV